MFCKNCGKELNEGAKFCRHCGTKIQAQQPVEAPKPVPASLSKAPKKKVNTGAIMAVVLLVLIFIGAGVGAYFYFTGDTYRLGRSMKLAGRYIEQEEYDLALEQYSNAISIDYTVLEAYLGSADIHMKKGDFDKAVSILQKGMKKAKVQEMDEAVFTGKIQEITQQQISALVAEKKYKEAFSTITQIMEILDDGTNFNDQKTEIYLAQAKDCTDHYQALEILKNGYEITQNQSLVKEQENIYLKIADEKLAAGETGEVAKILTEGYEQTKGDAIDGKIKELAPKASWTVQRKIYASGSLEEITYDEEGKFLKSVCYDDQDRVYRAESNEYNELGLLYKRESAEYIHNEDYEGERDIYVLELYMYDDNKNEIAVYRYDDSKMENLSGYIVKSYNDKNLVNKEESFDWDGNTIRVTYYRYDSKGRLSQSTVEGTYSGYRDETRYSYDDNDNLILKVTTESSYWGSQTYTSKYLYDQNNLLIGEEDDNYKYEYEYDAEGRKIREKFDNKNADYAAETFYEYNAFGDMSLQYNDDFIISVTYEYNYTFS